MEWRTLEDKAVGPSGEEGTAWMWVGEPCIVGAVLHMQWEEDTRVQGAAGPSLVTVICSTMKSLLVRHYLVPSCLSCVNKPSVLTGSPLPVKLLRLRRLATQSISDHYQLKQVDSIWPQV